MSETENICDKETNSKQIKPKSNKKSDECIELKNIKYKTMLLNGSPKETQIQSTEGTIDDFLEKEKKLNETVPWNKLEKTSKIKKLKEFSVEYKKNNSITDEEEKKLFLVLKNALDRKNLQKVKEITYDKDKGEIVDIPLLSFNENSRKFVLKRSGSKISTFTPKKRSIRNKGKVAGKNMRTSKAGKGKNVKNNKAAKTTKIPRNSSNSPTKCKAKTSKVKEASVRSPRPIKVSNEKIDSD